LNAEQLDLAAVLVSVLEVIEIDFT